MLRHALIALCLSAAQAAPAFAQEDAPAEFLVTADQLSAAKKEADDLLASGDCKAALPALDALVKKANMHGNLIYAGARSALENARVAPIPDALRNQMRWPLESYEAALKVRNEGWVSIAECMVKIDQQDAAVGAYLKALELTNIGEERETWDRARIGLWRLLGVTAQ